MQRSFFLGRQTWGEKALLQGGEIGLRLAPEAKLTSTTLVARVEVLTQCLPSGNIGESQVSGRERNEPSGTRSHHAHPAAYDQGGRGPLASGDAPLDMAGGAKVLFQVIVRARQIFDLIILEESVPVTRSDFPEVGDCRSERAQLVLLLCHGLQQLLICLLQSGHIKLLGVSEQVSGLMHPGIGLPDGWPELLRRRQ